MILLLAPLKPSQNRPPDPEPSYKRPRRLSCVAADLMKFDDPKSKKEHISVDGWPNKEKNLDLDDLDDFDLDERVGILKACKHAMANSESEFGLPEGTLQNACKLLRCRVSLEEIDEVSCSLLCKSSLPAEPTYDSHSLEMQDATPGFTLPRIPAISTSTSFMISEPATTRSSGRSVWVTRFTLVPWHPMHPEKSQGPSGSIQAI